MSEVTYSWSSFSKIVGALVKKLVVKLTEKAMKKQQAAKEDGRASTLSLEVEIDSTFFREKLMPTIHQTFASNVKVESVAFFNLVFSFRLALMHGSVT